MAAGRLRADPRTYGTPAFPHAGAISSKRRASSEGAAHFSSVQKRLSPEDRPSDRLYDRCRSQGRSNSGVLISSGT